MEISDGIHRIEAPLGNRYIAMYLVVGDHSSLLVDSGINDSIPGTLLPYMIVSDIPPNASLTSSVPIAISTMSAATPH